MEKETGKEWLSLLDGLGKGDMTAIPVDYLSLLLQDYPGENEVGPRKESRLPV